MSPNGALRDRWLMLILLLALVLRTYHLAYPPWDYHNWRQTMTLMVARDLSRHGLDLLHPIVAWVTDRRPSSPSYFGGEFPIQSALAAVLFKLFGESDAIARMVTIAFSLLGIFFLYGLLNRRSGVVVARLGAFVYSLLPYHLYFGRVFMPDVPALTLALGGLDALDRWTDNRKWSKLAAAGALTALAILQKLTVIFVALPVLYLFWLIYGKRLLFRIEPYVFTLMGGIPPLVWYSHAMAMTRQGGFSIAQPAHAFAHDLGYWLQLSFVREIFKALALEAFSPLGIGLAVIGLAWPWRGRAAWLFRWWVAGAALLLFLIPDNLPENHYYLSLLMPGGAALAGLALSASVPHRKARPLLALLLGLYAAGAIYSAVPFYQPDRLPRDLGVLLNRLTEPDDLIVTESGGSPNMLYFADRRGWMLAREYDVGMLERFAQAGARYYADTFVADAVEQRTFFRALDARFERLTPEDASGSWPIYRLSPPPGVLREVPPGEMQAPRAVNFGDEIELRGVTLRHLLDWPASFEVTYYWRCLIETSANLRIFVHITNAAGQMAYQQDHWPLGGRLPVREWKNGDIVRERYVVELPGSLPEGEYQLRLGWFDPLRGTRLPVLSPGVSDQEDRAPVATIQVRRRPRYGWFSPD